jgi:NAD(P)-dependent dehydrogenase (short-subunit alcohol dehydrogenase family)
MAQPTALVAGVAAEAGLGGALCRKFAAEGYHVFVGGRTRERTERVAQTIRAGGGSAEAVTLDVTDEAQTIAAFDRVMAGDNGREPADLFVFNAGNNRRLRFAETTLDTFESFIRVGCIGGFLFGREAARRLAPLGRGSVLFTGASASLRGRPGFAHFAASKAGLRMIAQAMAREFGPQGIHVAHVVIDGGIDGERLRQAVPEMAEQRGEDGLLGIDAIAETYWQIHRQPRSAWAFEVDLRPFKEPF